MNRQQSFLKVVDIMATTPGASGDRELIVLAL